MTWSTCPHAGPVPFGLGDRLQESIKEVVFLDSLLNLLGSFVSESGESLPREHEILYVNAIC